LSVPAAEAEPAGEPDPCPEPRCNLPGALSRGPAPLERRWNLARPLPRRWNPGRPRPELLPDPCWDPAGTPPERPLGPRAGRARPCRSPAAAPPERSLEPRAGAARTRGACPAPPELPPEPRPESAAPSGT